jgi:hypothetical protein
MENSQKLVLRYTNLGNLLEGSLVMTMKIPFFTLVYV